MSGQRQGRGRSHLARKTEEVFPEGTPTGFKQGHRKAFEDNGQKSQLSEGADGRQDLTRVAGGLAPPALSLLPCPGPTGPLSWALPVRDPVIFGG